MINPENVSGDNKINDTTPKKVIEMPGTTPDIAAHNISADGIEVEERIMWLPTDRNKKGVPNREKSGGRFSIARSPENKEKIAIGINPKHARDRLKRGLTEPVTLRELRDDLKGPNRKESRMGVLLHRLGIKPLKEKGT